MIIMRLPASTVHRLAFALAITLPVLSACDPGSHGAASDPAVADLVRELKSTNELLLRVATKLEQPATPGRGPGASEAARQSLPPGSQDLEHVLQDIRTALAGLAASLDRGRASANEPLPAKKDSAIAETAAAMGTDPIQASKRHFLWSTKQVLDTYGLPDHAREEATGMTWTYQTVESNSLVFTFTPTDLVLRVSMH